MSSMWSEFLPFLTLVVFLSKSRAKIFLSVVDTFSKLFYEFTKFTDFSCLILIRVLVIIT